MDPKKLKSEEVLRQLAQAVGNIESRLKTYEANQEKIVNHVNVWVGKIQGIDSVAYAALALHEGKKLKLNDESVKNIKNEVVAVIEEIGRYRDLKMSEEKESQKAKQDQREAEKASPDAAASAPSVQPMSVLSKKESDDDKKTQDKQKKKS